MPNVGERNVNECMDFALDLYQVKVARYGNSLISLIPGLA